MDFSIKLAGEADIHDVRKIRSRALAEEPISFAKSLDEYQNYSTNSIRDILINSQNSSFTFLAYSKSIPVGIVGYHINIHRAKIRHCAELNSFFVIESLRCRGIGSLLLKTLLQHARNMPKIKSIVLGVNTNNIPAISLYKRHGFKSWGIEPDALYAIETYYSLEHMMLKLH